MAKKLSAVLAKKLNALSFKAKSEEEARKLLLAFLEKNGIEGMDDEDTETLIDMAESFKEDVSDEAEDAEEMDDDAEDASEDDEDAEESEDDEADALADEVEAEDDEESDEDEDDSEDEEDDEESEDEEDEDEEEEKPAPKSKTAKKSAEKKPAAKTATPAKKTATRAEKKPAKTTAKAEKQPTTKRGGTKLNPVKNEDDRKPFEVFKKVFDKDFMYAWIQSYGVTVKYVGNNGKRGIFSIDSATRKEDGTVVGNLYLLTMAKQTDVLDELGIDYTLCWTKAPIIKNITMEEAVEILKKVKDVIMSFVSKADKRLGDNRKKMEDDLENSAKKNVKTAAKKAAAKPAKTVEPEDEEEDDDEVEQPVPKKTVKTVKKAAPAKKTAKSKK